MAKIVSELPASPTAAKYPWDEWFDGQIRELQQGEDFQPAAVIFRAQIYKQASYRGQKITLRQRGNKITIQAHLV